MAQRSGNMLVVVNAALLTALAVLTLGAAAKAQPAGPGGRARGNYQMVAGNMSGANNSPVFIVDSVNQELVALTWHRNAHHFEVFGWRSLSADSASASRNR